MPRFSFAVLCVAFLTVAACQPKPGAPVAQAATGGNERQLLMQADAERALGNDKLAAEHYLRAAEQSKGAVRAHLELAAIYRTQGEQDKALDILQRAHALNPSYGEVLKEYARQALLMGKDALALEKATDGLKQNPQDVRLLNIRGIANDRAGKHKEAQEDYRAALGFSTSPMDREYTTNNLALSLVADGRYAEAVTLLEAALPKAQNKAVLRQLLALAYGAAGNADKAYELGLKDLTLPQIQENLRFYEQLREGKTDKGVLFRTPVS